MKKRAKRKAVTQKDISLLAKVSMMTVSNYFRSPEKIASDTSKKIEKAIQQLEEQANTKSINYPTTTNRHPFKKIRFLSVGRAEYILQNPFYNTIFSSLQSRSAEEGYECVTHFIDSPQETKLSWFTDSDGVILLHHGRPISIPATVPVVQMLNSSFSRTVDTIDYNRANVSKIAAHYLIDQSVSSFLYIGSKEDERYQGFIKELENHSFHKIYSLIEPNFYYNEQGIQRIDTSILEKKLLPILKTKKIEGCFCESDQLLNAFHFLLFRLPQSVKKTFITIGCNNDKLFLDPISPRPASIDLNAQSIGSQAFDLLLNRIKNPTLPVVYTQLEPQLVV